MIERTSPSVLQNIDAAVALHIAHSRNISALEGLRRFLGSETHRMLEDNDLRLWHFSPLVIYDMWENEIATGDPRNSLYLRSDEIG